MFESRTEVLESGVAEAISNKCAETGNEIIISIIVHQVSLDQASSPSFCIFAALLIACRKLAVHRLYQFMHASRISNLLSVGGRGSLQQFAVEAQSAW